MTREFRKDIRGRGTSSNVTNRYDSLKYEASVNAYRGCKHDCSYCYARPTHEYLGSSPGLDFESKILVKEEAPKLLREALMKRSWQPEVINMSGMTDCYQPIFEEWLEVHRPLKKQKVLNSVRDIRGGKLNDANFGSRMRGEGARADQMAQMFALYTRKYNLNVKEFELSAEHFQRPGDQLQFNLD